MPAEQKKISHLMVSNIGLFYVCYRLSCMGWKVELAPRDARGVDVILSSQDARKTRTIKVKTLSKRNPVPFGTNRDTLSADFFVVCVRAVNPNSGADELIPGCFVLRNKELQNRISSRGEGDNKSYWLQLRDYESGTFRERWNKIGPGTIP